MKNLNEILNRIALAHSAVDSCYKNCGNYTIQKGIDDLFRESTQIKRPWMVPMLTPPYLSSSPELEPTEWSSHGPGVFAIKHINENGDSVAFKIKRLHNDFPVGCCCVNCATELLNPLECANKEGIFHYPSQEDPCSPASVNCCTQNLSSHAVLAPSVPHGYTGPQYPNQHCWIPVTQPLRCSTELPYENEEDAWEMLMWAMDPGSLGLWHQTQYTTVQSSQRWGDGTCKGCTKQQYHGGWEALKCFIKDQYGVSHMECINQW